MSFICHPVLTLWGLKETATLFEDENFTDLHESQIDDKCKGLTQTSTKLFNWASDEQDVKCHIDGLAQGCSISIANALEILQSCAKPSLSWHQ